jgi:hypothetical protein
MTMPRQKDGKPVWKSIAVKLPPELHQEVMDFTDRHHRDITISELVRDGIIWRMKQPVVPRHGQTTEPSDEPTPTVEERPVWDMTAIESRCHALEADLARLREQVQSLEARVSYARDDQGQVVISQVAPSALEEETVIPESDASMTTTPVDAAASTPWGMMRSDESNTVIPVDEEHSTPSATTELDSGMTLIPEAERQVTAKADAPVLSAPQRKLAGRVAQSASKS